MAARATDYVRPGVATTPPPEPGEDDWPNAYAWRADFWIPASVVPENTAGVIATLPVDVADVLETLTAADIRVVDAAGAPLAYRLVDYGADIARIAVLLPTLANDADTLIRIYVGKDDASGETNVAGVYAGYLQVIDGITGEDLTGNGRSLTPSGVSAGELSTGWPAGVYDGDAVMSSLGTSDWLAGYGAISVTAIVECDAGQDDITGAVYVNSSLPEGGSYGQDGFVLSRLATTSGGRSNVWHAKAFVAGAESVAYSLGETDTAAAELTALHASWASGEAPKIFKNGAEIAYSVQLARSGTTKKLGDGSHVGSGLRGKIAEVRVAPLVTSATKASLEASFATAPEAAIGHGEWYGPDDEGTPPIVALPVRAEVTAGEFVDIDVAASAIGTGTLTAVTQGQRGSVTIEAGEARYTPSGTYGSVDFFTATLSDGTFLSTARVDLVVGAVVPGGGVIGLPTPQRTVNVSSAGELTTALSNAQAGDHIVLADGSYGGGFTISGKNGTEEDPIVIRAANLLQATFGGEVQTCLTVSGGSHVWVHGLNFTGYILNGIVFSGQRHKFLRCRFADYGRSTYWTRSHGLTTSARTDFCEAAYCLFENPRTFHTWNSGDPQWPQWRWGFRAGGYQAGTASYDLTFSRCHFRNFPNTISSDYGSDQSEGIEVAATGLFTPTRMKIVYCLFENFPWDQGACIDVKGGDQGVIEYCTFDTSNMRGIDFRQCRQWIARHNWLEDTDGLSVYGPDHTLIGNRISGSGSFLLLRGNGDESINGKARVTNCLVRCNIGALRVGLDYSSSPTTHLPTGVQVDGHSGTVSIQSGSGVTQNPGYSCPSNTAFKLTSAEVGPEYGL